MRHVRTVLLVALAGLISACGASTATTANTAPTTGVPTTAPVTTAPTTVPVTTAPVTTVPVTTVPVTTVPVTTVPVTTTAPASTIDPSTLTDGDVARILGAVAQYNVSGDVQAGFTTRFTIVARLGRADDSGFVHYDAGSPKMSAAARQAIEASVAPATVTWMDDGTTPADALGTGEARLTLGAPQLLDGRLAVAVGYTCAGLCGHGGFDAVVRDADGWTVMGPIGGGWIS